MVLVKQDATVQSDGRILVNVGMNKAGETVTATVQTKPAPPTAGQTPRNTWRSAPAQSTAASKAPPGRTR